MIPRTPFEVVAQLAHRIPKLTAPMLLLIGIALAVPGAAAQDSFSSSGVTVIRGVNTSGTIGPPCRYYLDFDTVANDPAYAEERFTKLGWTPRTFEVRNPDQEELDGGFDDFMNARAPSYSDLHMAPDEDAFANRKTSKHVWSWEDDWHNIKMVRSQSSVASNALEEFDPWVYNRLFKTRQRHWNWRSVGPNVKAIKIIFFEKPTKADVDRALSELQMTGCAAVAVPPTFCTSAGEPTLEDVLTDIEHVRNQYHPLKLIDRVQIGAATELQPGQKPLIRIYEESNKSEAYKSLYKLAQSLTDDPVKLGIYKGAESCANGKWDKAWFYFEGVNDLAKDNPLIAEQIVDIYRTVEPPPPEPVVTNGMIMGKPIFLNDDNRDLEICVWLTRVIRNTLDWEKFIRALNERNDIECRYSAQYEADNQKLSNLHWDAERMPLKVYFHGADKEAYNPALMENFRKCVEYWSTASGTKIDFVLVSAKDQPDITLEWVDRRDNLYNIDFQDRTHVPRIKPFGMRLGQTWVEKCADNKKLIDHARIEIFNDYDMIDERLLSVLLHETGHAFGIRKHLNDPSDIMYHSIADADEKQKTKLTESDIRTMHKLYGAEPICHGALERFVALPALCNRVLWTKPPIKIARAANQEPTAQPTTGGGASEANH